LYWLKLIRWKNLLIIFATQWLIWACVILPVIKKNNLQALQLLNAVNFSLLSFSTILIAAAGYIINDYFDIRIDFINKPEKMVLEKNLPRRKAIILHTMFTLLGILLAAYIAAQRDAYEWITVQLFCSLLLWFYSTKFKQRFVIGNIIVALLTMLTIATLVVYEPALHLFFKKDIFIIEGGWQSINPLWFLGFYAFFAFILTWMREIVKDMEDLEGDMREGCRTLPIKCGLLKATRITQYLGIIAWIPLLTAACMLVFKQHYLLGFYTLFALVIPLLIWIINLQKKATKEHYAKHSSSIKIIMVLGLGSLIINLWV